MLLPPRFAFTYQRATAALVVCTRCHAELTSLAKGSCCLLWLAAPPSRSAGPASFVLRQNDQTLASPLPHTARQRRERSPAEPRPQCSYQPAPPTFGTTTPVRCKRASSYTRYNCCEAHTCSFGRPSTHLVPYSILRSQKRKVGIGETRNGKENKEYAAQKHSQLDSTSHGRTLSNQGVSCTGQRDYLFTMRDGHCNRLQDQGP